MYFRNFYCFITADPYWWSHFFIMDNKSNAAPFKVFFLFNAIVEYSLCDFMCEMFLYVFVLSLSLSLSLIKPWVYVLLITLNNPHIKKVLTEHSGAVFACSQWKEWHFWNENCIKNNTENARIMLLYVLLFQAFCSCNCLKYYIIATLIPRGNIKLATHSHITCPQIVY